MNDETGIVERIKSCPTRDGVLALLREMEGFSFISEKTSRKAHKTAKLRIKTLAQELAGAK